MIYRTIHETSYRYDAPVSQSLSEARLTPRSFPGQRVLETSLSVLPAFATMDTRTEYFGNIITTIAVLGLHDRFTVTAASVVETGLAPHRELPDVAWEAVRDKLAAPPDQDFLAASEYVFGSPYVPLVKAVADYGRATFTPTFTPGRSLAESARALTRRIHEEFIYKPEATSIDCPIEEVIEKRHGVCQDFAHVMIGALRSVGLAARYVSGYLKSGSDVHGAEASHAWVSVYLPGAGWVDFDPTNDVMPTTGHVTVGWGRDFGDVTPLKGVALGGGGQTVDVEVRVTPV
jgi:transglutaminase-like putative cysteine protease